MENELIKTTVRVGNSAGVLLPKEWLNREVKVILQPINVEKKILEILLKKNILKNALGVYLVGSYARDEQSIESDIDVLVVTDELNRRVKVGKYDILLISKNCLEKKIKNDLLPILPMLKEARVIINSNLRESYSKTKLSWKNIGWYIETTDEMMKEVSEDIEFSKKIGKKVSDASAYSLILRLRTLYIIDCLKKGKIWKKRELLGLIEKISGSTSAYKRYIQSKKYKTKDSRLLVDEAEGLRNYVIKKTKEIKEWLKGIKG